MNTSHLPARSQALTLVLGGSGKTGSRVAQRLAALGAPLRIGSRSGTPRFDWHDRATWAAALENVESVYLAYYPDLGAPGASGAIRAFVDLAEQRGIRRLVLLSGRGEQEARRCEQIVQASGLAWTIVRSSWFAQNWSEGFFRDLILGAEIALPVGDVGEPFIDVDDIADVVVAALTEDRHIGRLYDVTGPRLLSFREAIAEISNALGRELRFARIGAAAFSAALRDAQVPDDMTELLIYLFSTVLDGRNAHLSDGVQRALGRPPRDFAAYVRDAVAANAWPAVAEGR